MALLGVLRVQGRMSLTLLKLCVDVPPKRIILGVLRNAKMFFLAPDGTCEFLVYRNFFTRLDAGFGATLRSTCFYDALYSVVVRYRLHDVPDVHTMISISYSGPVGVSCFD